MTKNATETPADETPADETPADETPADETPAAVCGNCRHWHLDRCRRYPPRRTALTKIGGDLVERGVWPRTDSADWCGEHGPPD